MLRARKKDVRIKPNRKLDKRSSRGMLYENEELRLRTIEINAEVERGQTDIKKLRRENDHLRREMWALRDEYERLEKLIKHLDLAGTGSEHHQRGHQHSDGEGGRGGAGGDDDEDDDEDDRASPSLNGRNSNSEASDDDDDDGQADGIMDRSAASDGFPSVMMSRSKSQTAMTGDFRHSTAPPTAASSKLDMLASSSCHCHEAASCGHHSTASTVGGAVYVECGNPDKDNIENYQKAYGRMPRRCSSAGAKVYVATQHFHPSVQTVTAASVSSSTDASSSRVCYESLSAVKSRYSTSGMEDEDGYAACSHPVRVDLRDFLHPTEHPSSCPNRQQTSVLLDAGMKPPNTPPPPIPSSASSSTTTTITTTAIHPVRAEFVVQELAEAVDEGGSSSGVEGDDEPSTKGDGGGGGRGGGGHSFPPDTPSEDGDFNLDHLVNIVRSFQQEQELHQSGLVVATCPGFAPTPTTPDVLVEEAEDDVVSQYSSSPEASGMATIKRRPVTASLQQRHHHRQIAIIERESGPVNSGGPSSSASSSDPTREHVARPDESCGADAAVTYAQPTRAAARRPSVPQLCRNSFSASSSSSSASGSPTATHSSTVVFLNNNNNNNNNINNNKKLAGSSGYLGGGGTGRGRDVTDTTVAVATTSNIEGIVVTSTRKSSSPIRIAHPPHVLPLPPPPLLSSSSSSVHHGGALEPTVLVTSGQLGGALSRRRTQERSGGADESEQESSDRNCLSVYPLPDGDASASLLRLHAVDPHTVSFDTKELTAVNARSVTVQEVIDQLEQQLDPTRCHVRGVRMLAGSLFFISLDSARSLQYLLRHSFRLRGHRVRLTDVSAQTWVVSLTGVPHYISDATVSLLLAAFGTIVGDVERRFFRGVDTGERLVRFRLKGHAKLPRHITVGGCRIQVRRMSPAPNSSSQQRGGAHSDFTSFGPAGSPAGTAAATTGFQNNPTGMNRRIRLDSQADFDHSDFASSSATAAEPVISSLGPDSGGGGHYASKIAANDSANKNKSVPKIGRSFEYRSQLRVDLRMSAEVPVPPLSDDELPPPPPPGSVAATTATAAAVIVTGSRVTPTPSCPVCEQQQTNPVHPVGVVQQSHMRHQLTPPPLPPAMVIHRCRHHPESGSGVSPVGQGIPVVVATTTGPSGDGRVHRESPPKSRVSVNFDETAAASSGSRVSSGTGTGRPSNTKTSTSTASNGILRKSVSGEEPPPESGNDGGNSAAGSAEGGQGGKGKNGLRLATAKKTARSFSLVDTFRVNKERRKPVVRVETVIENTSAANPEEGVRTLVVRRDSAESSSRSSRSSRKSNELPWCGCWGNGCL